MRRHPGEVIWARTKCFFVNRELSFAAAFLAVTVLFGVTGMWSLSHYTTRVEVVGDTWFKVPIPVPVEERVRYLRTAVFLWAMALLSLVAAISLFVQHHSSREARAEARRAAREEFARQEVQREADRQAARQEYARWEAHQQWLSTPAGYAHSMLAAGYSRFNLVLRVKPPLHLDAVRQIEEGGWTVAERHDHPPVRTKESTADGFGGHEVVTTTVQDATFEFVRTPRPSS